MSNENCQKPGKETRETFPLEPHEQMAQKVREEANELSESQREELFRRGMQLIYGEPPHAETVGVRR